jgi:hypothetical protein
MRSNNEVHKCSVPHFASKSKYNYTPKSWASADYVESIRQILPQLESDGRSGDFLLDSFDRKSCTLF